MASPIGGSPISAAPAPARLLATQADADIFLTPAHDRVVFGSRAPSDTAAIWAAALK